MIAKKTLLSLRLIIFFIVGFEAVAADKNLIRPEDKDMMEALVRKVDEIKVPIDPAVLEPWESEGGEGESLIKIPMKDIEKVQKLHAGVRATLVGDAARPSGVIFYVKSNFQFYLVPFKGVDKIPQPLRLSKLASRFFRIESHRSGLGVMTNAVGP